MTATPAPFLRADLWSSSFWCIVLVIVSLFCMLPGFFEVPGVDRDETRFSHASRQMMAEQEYIDIPFQDGKRYKKPIGIYWLQIGAVKTLETVTGGTEPPIWAYRIPSLVSAVSAVVLTFWIAAQFVSPFAAGIAGMLMAISILPGFEAKIAKTDAVLLAFILLAQGFLAKAYLNREKPLQLIPWALFWGAIACGILVKGPVILLVTGATLLVLTVFDRSIGVLKRLRPLMGIAFCALLAAPWFIAIGLKSDGAFFVEAGLVDFLGKVTQVQESHGGPPGIYLALMPLTFWPASIFFLAALPWIIRNITKKPVLFAIAWVVPCWVVFELASTKLPHYVLPLYPALAIMTGAALASGITGRNWIIRGLGLLWIAGPLALATAALAALVLLEGIIDPFVLIGGLVSSFCALVAWRLFARPGRASHAVAFMALSAFALYASVYAMTFPRLTVLWPSNQMAAIMERYENEETCPPPSVLSVGYSEPSLAFVGPLDMRFMTIEEAAPLLAEDQCRQVFVTQDKWRGLAQAIQPLGFTLKPIEDFRGFKLNGGDWLTISFNAVIPVEEEAPTEPEAPTEIDTPVEDLVPDSQADPVNES